jgi:WD40 repeat protein
LLLGGHTNWVNSVAFSQDEKRIVSGSSDNTIRVWDAETGEVVVGPLEGHTAWVNSVAFSQDGKRIVSGSSDNTIRVWDAETGEAVVGPLGGHTNWVNSVAFSQDGKRIVSGSWDNTIRVWDAEAGEVVGPDDHGIVFGLRDTREVVGLRDGQTGGVGSVTFLPNGERVVSGLRGGAILDDDNLINTFTDSSRLEGGWIHNSSSQILFWVPSWNRLGLCWPRNSFVIARGSPSVHLDLHNFVHGDSWYQCKT